VDPLLFMRSWRSTHAVARRHSRPGRRSHWA
jgi:hypothetical protein